MRLPKPKKIIAPRYVAGLSLFKRKMIKIKLSANESALGASSKVKAILRKNVSTSKYPDYTSKLLRKQISIKFNCDANKIICGDNIFINIQKNLQRIFLN